MPTDGLNTKARVELAAAKLQAAKEIPLFRAALFPEDEP